MDERGVVVKTEGLSMLLNGSVILEDINLGIYPGEMVCIIGPNGAGKTTLLRILLGLVRPTSGTVTVFGVSPRDLGEKRDLIGYMPQKPLYQRNFPLSVLDVVAMGAVTKSTMGRPLSRLQRNMALQGLEKVGLQELAGYPFNELSGGQQQRVFLARALSKAPCLLFLDEPNAGLDLPTQGRFFKLLKELQEKDGLTVVMVSHDLAVVAAYANRLLCINRSMHVHGSPADVLNSPLLGEAYRCEYEVLFGRGRG